MWTCASKKTLKKSIFVLLLTFFVLGSGFYALQNTGALPGGNIALPKLFWLAMVIFCWFIFPLLFLLDQDIKVIRAPISIFLFNILLRAILELIMMFWTNNWHPYYGIAHDFFSLALSLFLAIWVWKKTMLLGTYLLVMAGLFAIESGFAWYMLKNVHNASGVVFYVPDGQAHQGVLQITTLVVVATVAYLFLFTRKWLYGTTLKS